MDFCASRKGASATLYLQSLISPKGNCKSSLTLAGSASPCVLPLVYFVIEGYTFDGFIASVMLSVES